MKFIRTCLAFWIASAVASLAIILPVTTAAESGPNVIWSKAEFSRSLAYSSDGQLLVEGGGDQGVKLRRADDGTLIRTFNVSWSNAANAVAISPDGQYVADGANGYNGNFNVWRVADGSLVAGRISAHLNGTNAVAFSPDSQLIATGGRDGTIKIWQLPTVTLIRTLNFGSGYRARVLSIAFSPDGQYLADASQAGVDLWRVSDGTLARNLFNGGNTTAVRFSPDGQAVAASVSVTDQYGQCVDCSVKIWRASDGALQKSFSAGPGSLWSLAFAPDGETLAVGSGVASGSTFNGVIRFFHVSDGAPLTVYNLASGSDSVLSIAYAPDGSSFAYTSYSEIATARSPYSSCSCAVSPGSKFFASSGGAGSINMTTGGSCNWSAQSNAGWIELTSAASGTGSATIEFEVRENTTGSPRSGIVTIEDQSFMVVQDGGTSGDCSYMLSPIQASYSGNGGAGSFNVTAEDRCAWSAESNVSWITITSPAAGIGNGIVRYTVASNPAAGGRKGAITINGQIFTVKQKSS